jgi:hypothetical protein
MNEISLIINIPTIILLSITLLVIGVCLFFMGYFYGLYRGSSGVSNLIVDRPKNFFDNNVTTKNNKILIDNTKVVTDIRTDNLEKKYESLGEIKNSEDNISESINKLKNLKR